VGFNPQALQVSEIVREADYTFRQKSEQAEFAIEKYSQKISGYCKKSSCLKAADLVEELDDEEIEELQEKQRRIS
jgi:hypothetical protein